MNRNEQYVAAVSEYLKRTRFKGASEYTLRNYETVLNKFGAFLSEQDENVLALDESL